MELVTSHVGRRSDFAFTLEKGNVTHHQKAHSEGPCGGCEHWSKCKELALSCKRFSRFVWSPGYCVTPDKYMHEPCEPSREEYVRMFGDDGTLPELPADESEADVTLPNATRQEILEAIDAAKETTYPDYMKVCKVGTREEWEAHKEALIERLRELLKEAQGETA